MDANISVATIVQHLALHQHVQVSETTVKRVLREQGLARRRGPMLGDESSGERHLELGGMKLVEAALVETGYLKALSVAVGEQLAAVPSPESAVPPDGRGRDELGRFPPTYRPGGPQ